MKRTRFWRRSDGAALVEFALVLPLLLTVVMGIVDFGRALFTLNNLTSAVREGARFAAVQSLPMNQDDVKAKVAAYFNNVKVGGTALDGSTGVNVTVTASAVKVGIAGYTFEPSTPLARFVPGVGAIAMRPVATFRLEQGI